MQGIVFRNTLSSVFFFKTELCFLKVIWKMVRPPWKSHVYNMHFVHTVVLALCSQNSYYLFHLVCSTKTHTSYFVICICKFCWLSLIDIFQKCVLNAFFFLAVPPGTWNSQKDQKLIIISTWTVYFSWQLLCCTNFGPFSDSYLCFVVHLKAFRRQRVLYVLSLFGLIKLW